ASDEDKPARLDRRRNAPGVLGMRLRCRIRRGGERLRVPHKRAQIGVFPLLDAEMRQPLLLELPERGLALRGERSSARQRRLARRETLDERGFGRRPDRMYVGVHGHAASSWYPA